MLHAYRRRSRSVSTFAKTAAVRGPDAFRSRVTRARRTHVLRPTRCSDDVAPGVSARFHDGQFWGFFSVRTRRACESRKLLLDAVRFACRRTCTRRGFESHENAVFDVFKNTCVAVLNPTKTPFSTFSKTRDAFYTSDLAGWRRASWTVRSRAARHDRLARGSVCSVRVCAVVLDPGTAD